MNYRLFGHTGARVAPLCIGAMNFGAETDQATAEAIIDAALDAGVNMIDTANGYNGGASEEVVGRALARDGKRRRVFLATKAHFPVGPGPNDRGNSRLHLLQACDDSLRRLGTDHIDLYQMHRHDADTPIEETLATLTDLVRAGKVRYIGCSTHPAWRVMEALSASERGGFVRYSSEQPPYNLLDRRIENELVPLALTHGLAIIPWAPMAQGVLAGRYASADAPPSDSRAVVRGGIYAQRVTGRGVDIGRAFAEIAAGIGISAAQLAILWVKDQPGVTAPIFGPRTLPQIQEILPVLEMTLDEATRAACDALVPPGSAVVNFHNSSGWLKQQI